MGKYPLRLRAAIALRVVNLDRQKFNEDVASKAYPCAPSTLSGQARLFGEDDLLTLFIFARLKEFGLSAKRAGALACEARGYFTDRENKPNDRIVFVQGTMSNFLLPSDQFDPDHEKKGNHYPGAGRIIFSIDFPLHHLRAIIADRIEYERSLLGEEDGNE